MSQAQTIRVLKKVSVATVFGKLKAEEIETLKQSNEEKFVGRFYGIANDFKTGQTQYGVWVGLVGSFRAVDGATGEICQGPVLLLPMGLCEQVAEVIKEEKKQGRTPSVQIAVDIYVKYRMIADTDKYEYVARMSQEITAEDPLEKLASTQGALPAIAKPLALAAPESTDSPQTATQTDAQAVDAVKAKKK